MMQIADISEFQQKQLLTLARACIHQGLQGQGAAAINTENYDKSLQRKAATFVTLQKQGFLRGCIGTLLAYQPLLEDIAEHAFAAAFKDPRFPPLDLGEFEQVQIEISILSAMTQMKFKDEADLLSQLQVNKHGLMIEDGHRKATFLPQVWKDLPSAEEFMAHLKMKAGLDIDHFSSGFKAHYYDVLSFSEDLTIHSKPL